MDNHNSAQCRATQTKLHTHENKIEYSLFFATKTRVVSLYTIYGCYIRLLKQINAFITIFPSKIACMQYCQYKNHY